MAKASGMPLEALSMADLVPPKDQRVNAAEFGAGHQRVSLRHGAERDRVSLPGHLGAIGRTDDPVIG
jgi:hypothetical protein